MNITGTTVLQIANDLKVHTYVANVNTLRELTYPLTKDSTIEFLI